MLALLLLAPDVPRLADVFLRDRTTNASKHAPLFESARANRTALALQILFGIYLLGTYAYINVRFWELHAAP